MHPVFCSPGLKPAARSTGGERVKIKNKKNVHFGLNDLQLLALAVG